ncbi:hypothetical protein THIOM_002075 [Candidatus Thiomargarita nelsonii]|uniref:Uncharacterized protein n=1 Tax=Candidatus Thiomargarita nelsonii TaxID=1003181 RepID=A0A176S2H0_9GAMM|nr:hypothetical protein THIOM_002075 [Candidatus Thiomargarita nelsonii]
MLKFEKAFTASLARQYICQLHKFYFYFYIRHSAHLCNFLIIFFKINYVPIN